MFRAEAELGKGKEIYVSPLPSSRSADVRADQGSVRKRHYGCRMLQTPLHLFVLNVPLSTFHFMAFLQMVPLILILSDPEVEFPDIVQQPRKGLAVTVPEKVVT